MLVLVLVLASGLVVGGLDAHAAWQLDGHRLPRFLGVEDSGGNPEQDRFDEDPPEVVTSLGKLVGRRRPDERPDGSAFETEYFLGVPFGKSTAGASRWRPPVPADPWPGTRQAFFDPPECPQLGPENAGKGSEDCLYLSVWRRGPRAARADGNVTGPLGKAGGAGGALKPVLVWIHGGGYIAGNAQGQYDASHLAVDHDLIVFNVQYRLGVFGFLALDSLGAEQPDGTTGNYGIQDQRLGMRWVRQLGHVSSYAGWGARGWKEGEYQVCRAGPNIWWCAGGVSRRVPGDRQAALLCLGRNHRSITALSITVFSAPCHPSRAVCYALLDVPHLTRFAPPFPVLRRSTSAIPK